MYWCCFVTSLIKETFLNASILNNVYGKEAWANFPRGDKRQKDMAVSWPKECISTVYGQDLTSDHIQNHGLTWNSNLDLIFSLSYYQRKIVKIDLHCQFYLFLSYHDLFCVVVLFSARMVLHLFQDQLQLQSYFIFLVCSGHFAEGLNSWSRWLWFWCTFVLFSSIW